MKKFLTISFFILIIMAFIPSTALSSGITVKTGDTSSTYNGTVYHLELNGVWVPTETPCIVVAGVAYVPLREVFQDYLGLTVGYDNKTEMAYVQTGSNKMEFSYKNQTIFQNGKKIDPPLPVATVNGNTMVPLSRTAGYFGYTVAVKSDNKTITIQWNNKTDTSALLKDTIVEGSVKKISYYPETGKETIMIETSAKEIVNKYVIPPVDGNPYYRLCVQFKNADIEKAGQMDVYAGSVQQIRYAQADAAKHIANIVIEVDHSPEYTVRAVTKGLQIDIVSTKTPENSIPSENSATPAPTQAPKPSPAPTKTPEPAQAAKPSPVPTKAPTPTQAAKPSPVPTKAPTPTQAAKPTPIPTKVPEPTPAATPTPAPIQQVGNGPLYYTMEGKDCVIWLDGINLPEQTQKNPDLFKVEYRAIEKMLQIRIPLTERYKTEVLPGNTLLHGIITFSSNLRQEVNIRISGKEALNYIVASNGDKGTKIIIKADGSLAQNPAPTTAPSMPATTPSPLPLPTPVQAKPTIAPVPSNPTPTPRVKPQVTPVPTQPAPTTIPSEGNLANRGEGDRSGTVSYVTGSDKIIIDTIGLENYKIHRLSNPSRIVIDLYHNIVDSREFNYPSGRLYTKISTGQLETTTARIVLEVPQDPDWHAVKDDKRLTVTLKPSGIKNMAFNSDGNAASLTLKGADLKQKIEQSMSNIIMEDDDKAKTFSFVFKDGLIDLGTGGLLAGDHIMKGVQTLTSGNNAFLVIERENADISYRLRFTQSNDEVIIESVFGASAPGSGTDPGTDSEQGKEPGYNPGTPVKPEPSIAPTPPPSGKLVVLDPGHGGNDPGATYGKDEKWYNLDITKRVETILKSKGVNVKLTRTTDVFVGLDERAQMANDWAADVFISIHNNAFFDKSMNGTMTFFYPGSYKGKEYATIIQKDLLKNLSSKDIGVKSNTFVVIKKTHMPAVLVEIGCLSNDAERAKLDTEEYRQKAAESLAESILKIVGK